MAYGSQSIPRVEKIFGPGNAWVTAAKAIVAGDAGGAAIDMPAGPSEVLVIADRHANAAYIAADLLSQAEHGVDSQVLLLSTDADLAGRALTALSEQLDRLPRRDIARRALQNSHVIITTTIAEAISISNNYAPEHLILHTENGRALLPAIRHAGSVFIGAWSPESAGDYCSGTNHVLPTYGAAKRFSGLGVEQFTRHMTVQELSRDGLRRLAPAIIELAAMEGLDAHANAVRLRLADEAGDA
jgi:histidinol dehydrogenase